MRMGSYCSRFFTLAAAALIWMAATTSVAVTADDLSQKLIERGWEHITFDGKKPNTYATCGDACVEISTDDSVSMIGRRVQVNLDQAPIMSWEWQIRERVPESDLETKGRDDRAIAVYVTIPYDPDKATLAERLLRPVIELARGADAPSKMLSFVWAGKGEVGDTLESPYQGSVNRMIIARNAAAPVSEWVSERRDLRSDFQRVFGSQPDMVAHVLISADSDDISSSNRAKVRNISFSAQ